MCYKLCPHGFRELKTRCRKPNDFDRTKTTIPTCPPRVRIEWNQLEENEKAEYLRQVKTLMELGEYKTFVDMHYHKVWNGRAHSLAQNGDPAFLTWHRAYLYEFESAVRRAKRNILFYNCILGLARR